MGTLGTFRFIASLKMKDDIQMQLEELTVRRAHVSDKEDKLCVLRVAAIGNGKVDPVLN
jgi:hypothetical protein